MIPMRLFYLLFSIIVIAFSILGLFALYNADANKYYFYVAPFFATFLLIFMYELDHDYFKKE
jgi:hypothetical protein